MNFGKQNELGIDPVNIFRAMLQYHFRFNMLMVKYCFFFNTMELQENSNF